MPRLRVVSVLVQIEAFVDEGEELVPLPVQPVKVPFGQWPAFIGGAFDGALAGLRRQVEGPPAAPGDDEPVSP